MATTPPGTTSNVINTVNPVANPVVPVAPSPVSSPKTASQPDVSAQIAAMQKEVIAKSSLAQPSQVQQQQTIQKAQAAPGTVVTGQTTGVTPSGQGVQPVQTQFQARTNSPAQDQEAAIKEVMRLNSDATKQMSYDEAKQRYLNAKAFESGQVAVPMQGVVYDPSTGTYKDPLTKNHYAGFDPTLGNIFTPDQRLAVQTMFKQPDGGALTSEDLNTGRAVIGDALNYSRNNPLPMSGTTVRAGTQYPVGTKAGSEWEASLPPDLQSVLSILQDQAESMKTNDEALNNLIQIQQDQLASRQAAREADIHARAAKEIEDQKVRNAQAEGMVATRMAALGITGSSIDLQYTRDTIASGERALRDISDSERKAITEAQQAYDDNNLQLAFKKLDLAEQRRKEYTELALKQYDLKESFKDKLLDRQAKQQQLTMNDMELKEKQQASLDKRVQNAISMGVEYDTLPDSLKQDIQTVTGMSDAGMRSYFKNVQENKRMADMKSQAEVQKAWNESVKSKLDLALKLPEGQSYSETLPDGTVFSIQGMKPVSEDWKTTTATLGNNKYGPPGQYILSTDKSGNVVNAQFVGDHFTAPYFDSDTGWKIYSPVNNTETTVFNGGTYGEGFAGLQPANEYVSSLASQGFKVTQEPGEGFSHSKLTGWDVAMPVGTPLRSPTTQGVVVKTGSDPKGYGNYVDVQDIKSGQIYRFGHLSNIGVKPGQAVDGSTNIGFSGNTGFSTGPHVHFELRTADDKPVVPNRNAPNAQVPVKQEQDTIYSQYLAEHPGAAFTKGVDAQGIPLSKQEREKVAAWSEDKKKQEIAESNRLRTDSVWVEAQKDFKKAQGSIATINAMAQPGGSGFNDVGALMAYARIVDPGGRTVTDQDLQNIKNSIPAAQRVLNLPSTLFEGSRLNDKGRKFLIDAATQQYRANQVTFLKQQVDKINDALASGVNPIPIIGTPGATIYEVYDPSSNEGVGTISSKELSDPELIQRAQKEGFRLRLKQKI